MSRFDFSEEMKTPHMPTLPSPEQCQSWSLDQMEQAASKYIVECMQRDHRQTSNHLSAGPDKKSRLVDREERWWRYGQEFWAGIDAMNGFQEWLKSQVPSRLGVLMVSQNVSVSDKEDLCEWWQEKLDRDLFHQILLKKFKTAFTESTIGDEVLKDPRLHQLALKLLRDGAPIGTLDGLTAAMVHHRLDLMQALIDAGVNVNGSERARHASDVPLGYRAFHHKNRKAKTPEEADALSIQMWDMLLAAGADVRRLKGWSSLLVDAIQAQDVTKTVWLIEHGSDLNEAITVSTTNGPAFQQKVGSMVVRWVESMTVEGQPMKTLRSIERRLVELVHQWQERTVLDDAMMAPSKAAGLGLKL